MSKTFEWAVVVALALLFTLLNALKPVHIDDAAYYYYAAQMARHPLDPYGFRVLWYDTLIPANHVLAPPVLPYWWSLAIRCFGDHPFLWKLWLLPFSLLFASSSYLLYRRFACGLELPLVIMTVLSPTFLPSLNLMLDVPALALGLAALVLFIRSCEGGSMALTLSAALLAGLAAQTKYTGLLAPITLFLYSMICGRVRYGLIAAFGSFAVFAGWECFIAWQYGESHFLHQLGDNAPSFWMKMFIVLPLVNDLGGTLPALILVGLYALGIRRPWITVGGVMVIIGYVLLALTPARYAEYSVRINAYSERLTVGEVIFGMWGIIFFLVVGCVAWQLRSRRSHGESDEANPMTENCMHWLLLAWFLLELAGYFALTPFPAVRRVMGLTMVATLLFGRLAARSGRIATDRSLLYGIAAGGALLGLGFYAVDLRDASAQQQAAEAAAAYLRPQSPATVWYVGHWGFQFYVERAGMRPVLLGESQLRKGDWLVVPDKPIVRQNLQIDPGLVEPVDTISVQDSVPLRTVQGYYGGPSPLEHHEGPRVSVRIYRITAAWAP